MLGIRKKGGNAGEKYTPVVTGVSGPYKGARIELGRDDIAFGSDPSCCNLVIRPEADDTRRKYCSLRFDYGIGRFYFKELFAGRHFSVTRRGAAGRPGLQAENGQMLLCRGQGKYVPDSR